MRRSIVLWVALGLGASAAAQPFGPATPEFRVNTYTTSGATFPAIASYGDSEFVVVWKGGDYSYLDGIFAQRYVVSQPAGISYRVNTSTLHNHVWPRVGGVPPASASPTRFVVAWVTDSGGSPVDTFYGLFGRRYGASGPLGGEFQINSVTADPQYVDVALDANGDFVVVWQEFDNSLDGIWARRYAADGTPAGSVFRVNTITMGLQNAPKVAKSSSGDFTVVWQSYKEFGTLSDIVAKRFSSSGAPLTNDVLVEQTTTEDHGFPAIAALGVDAGFVVVWEALPGPNWEIYARRYDASGGPLTGAFRVNTVTGVDHFAPSVAADPQGGFTIVWQALGEVDSYDVFGRHFAPSGAPIGGEFLVNTHTTGYQDEPHVAAASDGSFTVAWTDLRNGLTRLFARRYCALEGDADGNDAIDVADVFYLINNLFAGGPAPIHPSDVNGDGHVDVTDVFALINYLFAAGQGPVCVPAV